jgi:hypothetical protein
MIYDFEVTKHRAKKREAKALLYPYYSVYFVCSLKNLRVFEKDHDPVDNQRGGERSELEAR